MKYDNRAGRQPPSVLLAKLIADSKLGNGHLSSELKFQVDKLIRIFQSYQERHQLITVINPRCQADVFSDRWPTNLMEQKVYLDDLMDFSTKLARLKSNIDLSEMQKILTGLFGENPSQQVIEDFNEQLGRRIDTGRSRYRPADGGIDLGASGIVTAPAAGIVTAKVRQSRQHNFFGEEQ